MNWSEGDFDELYSRFGTGGQLTEDGILAAAQAMNAKRDIWRQVSVILESGEAELLVRVRRAAVLPRHICHVACSRNQRQGAWRLIRSDDR